MADWDDVRRLVAGLPEVTASTSHGRPAWRVRKALFAWERPLAAADRAHLGDAAPAGEVLGVSVADEGVKRALVAAEPWAFTTPHFDGYAAVLVDLAAVPPDALRELLVEAWLCRAPKRLAQGFSG